MLLVPIWRSCSFGSSPLVVGLSRMRPPPAAFNSLLVDVLVQMPHAVCLGFDFDAVSGWIHGYDAVDSPTELSRGEYGARVGVPRILDLLDRLDVTATFFTPGHTIESYLR